MTVTAIVCSHANRPGLDRILDVLFNQTWPPDEILAHCSGYTPQDLEDLVRTYPSVTFEEAEDFNDWGHQKRANGLEQATMDWVGFFNDDDWYESHYLETMLAKAQEHDADVVYCAWNEQPNCDFALTHSTAGNFIVKTDIGREAGGWPRTRIYENDGHFVEAIKVVTDRVSRVDELLYHHNAGY